MNRAEAWIKGYQNSNSQLNPMRDFSLGNSGGLSFISHMTAMRDESNLARKMGRKKKRR